MPKNAIDYSKSVIYKICCRDVSVKEIYVGSTTCVVDRRAHHKHSCGNEAGKYYELAVYLFIRDHGGWENWELVVVEAFPCKTSEETRTRERFWMESLGATLNSNNPIRTPADQALQCRTYREAHREEISEHKKKYHVEHREHILEYQNQYRAANIEAVREKQNIRYAANRDTINEKKRELITCDCGAEVRRADLARHKKTAKHIEAMEAI